MNIYNKLIFVLYNNLGLDAHLGILVAINNSKLFFSLLLMSEKMEVSILAVKFDGLNYINKKIEKNFPYLKNNFKKFTH